MRWLASNWFIILFVVAMVWMHAGHGGHGGHGGRHQPSRTVDRDQTARDHGGHAGPANPAPAAGDDRSGPSASGPRRAA